MKTMKPGRHAYKVKVIFLILFTFTACTHNKKASELNTIPSTPQPSGTAEDDYVLHAGDKLEIKFYNVPELDEEVTIRPDGKISLQLIDDVQAVGLTTSELDKILTQKYAKNIKEPEITIIVRTFSTQKVYVGGEVSSPQLIALHENLTALQAIYMAEGFKETGGLRNVLILRNSGSQKPEIVKVDMKRVMKNKEKDVYLKPYDIVYVPKTSIAKADKFVDQYINQIIPRNIGVGFGFVYDLNRPKQESSRPIIETP
jgi:protein involved in polysaccharide export with SLBB domain